MATEGASTLPLSKLLNLPTEIRQQIIRHALPQEYNVSEGVTTAARSLLLSCVQLNLDTKEVLKKWSPVLLTTNPDKFLFKLSYILDTLPLSSIRNLKISIYGNATITFAGGGPRLINGHEELPPITKLYDVDDFYLQSNISYRWWNTIREALPLEHPIDDIEIDITPLPFWLRDECPQWVELLMDERQFDHDHVLGTLFLEQMVPRLFDLCKPRSIRITGHLPHKDRRLFEGRIESVVDRCNRIVFEIMWTPYLEDMPMVDIRNSGLDLVNEKMRSVPDDGPKSWNEPVFWVKMKDLIDTTPWDEDAEEAFRLRYELDYEWTLEHFLELMTFVIDGEDKLACTPQPRCRRWLTTKLARSLDLYWTTESDGFRNHILLSRTPEPLE